MTESLFQFLMMFWYSVLYTISPALALSHEKTEMISAILILTMGALFMAAGQIIQLTRKPKQQDK